MRRPSPGTDIEAQGNLAGNGPRVMGLTNGLGVFKYPVEPSCDYDATAWKGRSQSFIQII